MPGFNRERLTEIRTVRGVTMEQLANALGITKQMISKYEDGKSIPQIEAIHKIAGILSVPKQYLFKDSVARDANSSTLFLRAPLATPQKTRAFARIVSGWCYEISKAIIDLTQPLFDFSLDAQLTIPEKAMELRRQWKLGTKPIRNMVALLESHGFNIFSVDSPELKTEAYSQIINGIPIIVLNKQIGTSVRQRFSLAHELGHIVLHSGIVDWEFDLKSKEIENEAHLFAEYFLLPTKGFDNSFVSPRMEHLISLKKEWLVSLRAMIFHCERVGLIDASKSFFLQQQISAQGWQKFEPLDNDIEFEKPISVGNLISNKVTDRDTFVDFYDEIRLPIDYIENLCSLPTDSLMKFYDDYLDGFDVAESNQLESEQLTLFDVGGVYYA